MGIENWPDKVEADKPADSTTVDEPRRHMLGSFRPGLGFAPSEIDCDETLTAPIDVEADEAPFSEADETVDARLGHP